MLNSISPLAAQEAAVPHVVLGIHWGAGVPKNEMKPELEKHLRAGLEQALKEGYAALVWLSGRRQLQVRHILRA